MHATKAGSVSPRRRSRLTGSRSRYRARRSSFSRSSGETVTVVLILPGGAQVAIVTGEIGVVVGDRRQKELPILLPGNPGELFVAVTVSGGGRPFLGTTAGGRFHLFSMAPQP